MGLIHRSCLTLVHRLRTSSKAHSGRMHLRGRKLRSDCMSTAYGCWLRLQLRLLLLLLHLRSLCEAQTWLSWPRSKSTGWSARGHRRRSVGCLRSSSKARSWLTRWLLLDCGSCSNDIGSFCYRCWNISRPRLRGKLTLVRRCWKTSRTTRR